MACFTLPATWTNPALVCRRTSESAHKQRHPAECADDKRHQARLHGRCATGEAVAGEYDAQPGAECTGDHADREASFPTPQRTIWAHHLALTAVFGCLHKDADDVGDHSQ